MLVRAMMLCAILTMTTAAHATVIEPDDYPSGTVVSQISPQVDLSTADSSNVPFPFAVTATDDNLDYAPTGTNVFAHVDIPFFNNDRRLRMDFASPVGFIGLLFAGGRFGAAEIGRLEAFDAGGQLVASYVTAPRGPGEVEGMSVVRPQTDIAWAVAYSRPEEGVFGRFDRLEFAVPEPAGALVLLLAGIALRRR